MKQKLLLVILCLFGTGSYAQEAFKLDSLKFQNWDTNTNNWLDNLKQHYYYDDGVKDSREYQFIYQNDVWDSISRTFKTYNASNNITQELIEAFDIPNWADAGKIDYGYTAQDLLEFKLTSIPIGGGQFLESQREDFTYDTLENVLEKVVQVLNPVIFMLENSDRELFTYDGMLLSQDISQLWDDSQWLNEFRRDYFYNPNDLPDFIDRFNWENNIWGDIVERTSFTYDANNLATEVLVQVPIAEDDFVNVSRNLNSYDSAPNLIQVVSQEWNGIDDWDNLGNLIQNYDVDNNIEEQITQIWDNGDWLNQARVLSYWSPAENLSITFFNVAEGTKVFPNPTADVLQVAFSEQISASVQATLYDVLGKKINSQNVQRGTTSFEINLNQQTRGVYLLEIVGQADKQVYRIIKE